NVRRAQGRQTRRCGVTNLRLTHGRNARARRRPHPPSSPPASTSAPHASCSTPYAPLYRKHPTESAATAPIDDTDLEARFVRIDWPPRNVNATLVPAIQTRNPTGDDDRPTVWIDRAYPDHPFFIERDPYNSSRLPIGDVLEIRSLEEHERWWRRFYGDELVLERRVQASLAARENLTVMDGTSNGTKRHLKRHGSPAGYGSRPGRGGPSAGIPRIIWTYWDGPEALGLPNMVATIVAGWRWYNPAYNVTVIYNTTITDYTAVPLPVNFWNEWMASQRGNWVKAAVLTEWGGVFIDPTIVLTSDLGWLRTRMQRPRGRWGQWSAETQSDSVDRQDPVGFEAFAFYMDYHTERKDISVYETYFIATVAQGRWITALFGEYNTVCGNFHCNDAYNGFLRHQHGEKGYRAITVLTVEGPRRMPVPDTMETEKGPYTFLKALNYDDWEYARWLMLPDKPARVKMPPVLALRTHTLNAIEYVLGERSTEPPRSSVFGIFIARFNESRRARPTPRFA
ncbi:hypothetical protein HDU96_004501, partial [Phlyctochytrium bullatum]